jgi:hypothetical protein
MLHSYSVWKQAHRQTWIAKVLHASLARVLVAAKLDPFEWHVTAVKKIANGVCVS